MLKNLYTNTPFSGQEFRAKVVQALMKKHNIIYANSQNETKASISERAIETLKMRITRFLTYQDNNTYLPVLQDIANSYNKTQHRTIGTAPVMVNKDNEEEVRLSTYFAQNHKNTRVQTKLRPYKFKVGSYVRVTHLKTAFMREYDATYTGELFIIWKRYHRQTLPVYRLKDLDGEEITGSFYESEMQLVEYDPNKQFKIEKILRTRGKGKNKQYLVKWKFYRDKFTQWVHGDDFK